MTRKILFVCTGNTCRSPMAEGIFRQAADGHGFEVGSAGVAAYGGGPASPETMKVLKKRGIKLEGFQSRLVDEEMMESAEAVFCMTEGHRQILVANFPEWEKKIFRVCDFVEIQGKVGRDVPDPIGMGLAEYQKTAEVLEQAMAGILGFLKTKAR